MCLSGSLEDQDLPLTMRPDSQLPAPSLSHPPSSLLLKDCCPWLPLFSLPHSLLLLGPVSMFPFPQDWARVRIWFDLELDLDLSHVLWDL